MAYESLMVFTGNANPLLAHAVVRRLNIPIGHAKVGKFSDGESTVELLDNVRGKDCFVLQSTCAPTNDSLIEYPCDFPIKVMGEQAEGFVQAMLTIVRHFDPAWDDSRLSQRSSSTGKYLGLTLTVKATSREQLDELYRTLSSDPMVKVVL